MAKGKLKAEIQADLDALETQYVEIAKEHAELKETHAQYVSTAKTNYANLRTENIKLAKDLKSTQGKVKVFHEMLQQEQELTRTLEDRIQSFREGTDELEGEITEQFQLLKTAIANAEKMILG